MRVGIVSKWFNRGQPVVGRQTRSALDELGHETFVLARPKKERGPRPVALDRDDVWDQPGVTEASAYDVAAAEYERWVDEHGIEAIFCDQNYQFAELASLHARGVRTIGRFVWEHFTADHVAGAREAYDIVFSLTRAEQVRYREMGLETPYVRWGCHPELIAAGEQARASADPAAPGRIRAELGSPVAVAPCEEAGGTLVILSNSSTCSAITLPIRRTPSRISPSLEAEKLSRIDDPPRPSAYAAAPGTKATFSRSALASRSVVSMYDGSVAQQKKPPCGCDQLAWAGKKRSRASSIASRRVR